MKYNRMVYQLHLNYSLRIGIVIGYIHIINDTYMNNVRPFNTPAKIYIGCFIGFFLFLIVGIPVVSIAYSDGEQLPFALLRYTGDLMLLSFFILSITTSFMFKEWFRIYWILNLVIMCLSGYLLVDAYVFPLFDYIGF